MATKEEEFTFETIANVYREERKQTVLTKLPMNFYRNLRDYIDRLHEGYIEARAEDPNSPKTVMLEDEFERSQKRANQIYEYRERKISTIALSVANGGNPNTSYLTAEEKKAMDDMVETLTENRDKILLRDGGGYCEPDTLLKDEHKVSTSEKKREFTEQSSTITQEELPNNEVDAAFVSKPLEEKSVILVLEDIPPFSTEERVLDLKKDDVISLPNRYADILCRNEKARVIHGYN